jgi:hypothetical protein
MYLERNTNWVGNIILGLSRSFLRRTDGRLIQDSTRTRTHARALRSTRGRPMHDNRVAIQEILHTPAVLGKVVAIFLMGEVGSLANFS